MRAGMSRTMPPGTFEAVDQSCREYSRLFGAPPLRDIARLKALPESAFAV